jgi:hypothetical protein
MHLAKDISKIEDIHRGRFHCGNLITIKNNVTGYVLTAIKAEHFAANL